MAPTSARSFIPAPCSPSGKVGARTPGVRPCLRGPGGIPGAAVLRPAAFPIPPSVRRLPPTAVDQGEPGPGPADESSTSSPNRATAASTSAAGTLARNGTVARRLFQEAGELRRRLRQPDPAQLRELEAEGELVVINVLTELGHPGHRNRQQATGPASAMVAGPP